jgi:hypothetical protein
MVDHSVPCAPTRESGNKLTAGRKWLLHGRHIGFVTDGRRPCGAAGGRYRRPRARHDRGRVKTIEGLISRMERAKKSRRGSILFTFHTASTRSRRMRVPAFWNSKPSMAAPQAPEQSNAITIPNVSWDAEAEAVVRRKTNNEEAEKRRRSLAGPSDSQFDWARNNAPLPPDQHEAGDTERAAGGQVTTWVNDKCYWTTSGATSAGMSHTTKVCKDPPKPADELFKGMRKKLDDRDSTRLP